MTEFKVSNMSCGHCVRAVTEALRQVDPQAQVQVDLPTQRVNVQSSAEPAALAAALKEAGYPPQA